MPPTHCNLTCVSDSDLLKIMQKMIPVSYVRLQRSSKRITAVAKNYQRSLGILLKRLEFHFNSYVNSHGQVQYLPDSFRVSVFFKKSIQSSPEFVYRLAHLSTRHVADHLQGFAFKEILVEDSPIESTKKDKRRRKVIKYIHQAAIRCQVLSSSSENSEFNRQLNELLRPFVFHSISGNLSQIFTTQAKKLVITQKGPEDKVPRPAEVPGLEMLMINSWRFPGTSNWDEAVISLIFSQAINDIQHVDHIVFHFSRSIDDFDSEHLELLVQAKFCKTILDSIYQSFVQWEHFEGNAIGDSSQIIHQNGMGFVATRLFDDDLLNIRHIYVHFIKRYTPGYETQNRLPTPFDGHR